MFETLKGMYEGERLSKDLLRRAVTPKKWIDKDEYATICGEDFDTQKAVEKEEK